MKQVVVANSKGGVGKSTLVLSLADVLQGDVIDFDHQGTITVSSGFTKRHVPVSPNTASSKYVIYDTPPYRTSDTKNLFQEADIVLIPVKIGYADLLACKGVIDDLREMGISNKGLIIFNEVRKPHNKTYHEIKDLFFNNFKDIRKATTEIPNLIGFQRVLSDPLSGKPLAVMKSLVEELSI